MSRMARRWTIQCSVANTQTFRWTAGGRLARRGQARSEEGRRMGGWERGSKGGWGTRGNKRRDGGQREEGGRVQGGDGEGGN